MGLTHWWMLIPIVLAIVAWLVLFVFRDRPADESSGVVAANTDRMRGTDRFARLLGRHRRWSLVQVIAVVLIVVGASMLSTRLTNAAEGDNEQHNRDVMLCLDVSGSMRSVDAELMSSFAEISGELEGERIGLVIWDSSSVMKFPLTNDYAFITEQLEAGAEAMGGGGDSYDWSRGVFEGNGSSLIGDGLASCVQRFDRPDEARARTVVLATDNRVSGDAIYTLEQAVRVAEDREVVVHAIAPRQTSDVRDMRRLLEATGGNTFLMDDASGGDQIVAAIDSMDRQRLKGLPVAAVNDFRLPGLLLVGIGVLGLVAAGWRLRR